MTPPDDMSGRRRGAAVHPIRQPSPLQPEEVPAFLENQIIPKLEAISNDAMGARENARQAAAGAWAANARVGELAVQVKNLEGQMKTGFEALRKAILEAGRQGRERDLEIERRAAAASTKASGVRTALQSYQDLEAERRRAEELARALEAERDRRRDEEVAELRRRQDAIAAREAEYALAARQGAAIAKDREDKVSLKGALGGAGATQIVTTIIAAMQGQALTYAIGIGLGLGLTVVLFALVIRHFRKVSK